jgi:hypothetical protein
MTKNERSRKSYNSKKERGECINCRQPARPGYTMCEFHANKQARYMDRRNWERKHAQLSQSHVTEISPSPPGEMR